MMLKKNNTQERHKKIYETFALKYISTENKARLENDWLASKHSSTYFSPSLRKPVFFVVLYKHRNDKNVTVLGFGQNAQINLITSENSELMAVSHYPHTTRSLLKTGLLIIHYITIVFVQ